MEDPTGIADHQPARYSAQPKPGVLQPKRLRYRPTVESSRSGTICQGNEYSPIKQGSRLGALVAKNMAEQPVRTQAEAAAGYLEWRRTQASPAIAGSKGRRHARGSERAASQESQPPGQSESMMSTVLASTSIVGLGSGSPIRRRRSSIDPGRSRAMPTPVW